MHFLPDVYVSCETCKGARYNRETLEVRFKGKSIADVLDMSVEEALEFFAKIPKIRRRLQTLHDVGLDYIKLGQSATTLSGGEAQRVKLAAELCKVATGKTLYILDEPTTGLHFADIEKLLETLQRLVDAGNTMIVIEHNLDVIKQADWIVDLGPEGGEAGGEIVAVGTPEEVAEVPRASPGSSCGRAACARRRGLDRARPGQGSPRHEGFLQPTPPRVASLPLTCQTVLHLGHCILTGFVQPLSLQVRACQRRQLLASVWRSREDELGVGCDVVRRLPAAFSRSALDELKAEADVDLVDAARDRERRGERTLAVVRSFSTRRAAPAWLVLTADRGEHRLNFSDRRRLPDPVQCQQEVVRTE